MFLVRMALRIVLGVFILLLAAAVVGDLYARSHAQKVVAERVKAATGAQSVSVKINSLPFLYQVAFSKVPEIRIVAHEVPLGRLHMAEVTVDAHQVKVDRHMLLFSRKLKVDSVGSAKVTVLFTTSDLNAISELAGVEVSVTGGHVLEVAFDGRPLASVDLTGSPLVPACDYTLARVANGYSVSCTVSPVPSSLLATLSTQQL
jgi:hypothetical protein